MQIVRSSCFALLLGAVFAAAATAAAQTAPNGQVMAPGSTLSGATTNCPTVDSPSVAVTANVDANCAPLAPGFAVPSTNTPAKEQDRVTAVIRVNSVLEKPTSVPFPIEFNVVGEATMVKAQLPRLNACYAVGRGWSRRSQAATSTTCLDRKGEVIAYQECKPTGGVNSQPTCSTVMPKEAGDTVAGIR